jgi:hypothetical protein
MSYSLSTQKTWYETKSELEETFRKWSVRDFQIVGRPSRRTWQDEEERRVTVRFIHPSGREITVTMNTQAREVDNFRALYLGPEDMRMMEARGISDIVRDAYLQLAAPARQRDPYEVLGVRSDSPSEVIEAAYRAMAKKLHPDVGGDADAFKQVQDAYERIGR